MSDESFIKVNINLEKPTQLRPHRTNTHLRPHREKTKQKNILSRAGRADISLLKQLVILSLNEKKERDGNNRDAGSHFQYW